MSKEQLNPRVSNAIALHHPKAFCAWRTCRDLTSAVVDAGSIAAVTVRLESTSYFKHSIASPQVSGTLQCNEYEEKHFNVEIGFRQAHIVVEIVSEWVRAKCVQPARGNKHLWLILLAAIFVAGLAYRSNDRESACWLGCCGYCLWAKEKKSPNKYLLFASRRSERQSHTNEATCYLL